MTVDESSCGVPRFTRTPVWISGSSHWSLVVSPLQNIVASSSSFESASHFIFGPACKASLAFAAGEGGEGPFISGQGKLSAHG
jgi:hypothetical protein